MYYGVVLNFDEFYKNVKTKLSLIFILELYLKK
jgi:hypothetical protein